MKATVFCTQCGIKNDANQNHCRNCGAILVKPVKTSLTNKQSRKRLNILRGGLLLVVGLVLMIGIINNAQNRNKPTITTASVNSQATSPISTRTTTPSPQPTTNTISNPSTVETTNETLTFSSGDLPQGWTAGEVFHDPPVDYTGPTPSTVLSHFLIEPGQQLGSGRIVLLTFNTMRDAESAYQERVKLIQRTVDRVVVFRKPQLGDQSFLAPGQVSPFISNKLVFIQCKTVVAISLGSDAEADMVINYAKRVNERIRVGSCE